MSIVSGRVFGSAISSPPEIGGAGAIQRIAAEVVYGFALFLGIILSVTSVNAQSMRLQDAPLGSVVQIGSYNYIKTANNAFMQSSAITCPDGAIVGNKYVKCYQDKDEYINQTCCAMSCPPNSAYNSSQGKCVCDSGYTYNDNLSTCVKDGYDIIGGNGYNLNCSKYKGSGICSDTAIFAVDFDYTGTIQTYTAMVNGIYKLEVWGAQGSNATNSGGYGGYSHGIIALNNGDVLYVVVGGQGTFGGSKIVTKESGVGGYNGGGNSQSSSAHCGGGGGASHIATSTGVLSSLSTNKNNVLIVAGGGGGDSGAKGGHGGGAVAMDGLKGSHAAAGSGGTQSAGGNGGTFTDTSYNGISGVFGQGGNGGGVTGGGGGGGWYGGGGASGDGSNCDDSGGGGGSGYLNTTYLVQYGMYCYSGCSGDNTTAKAFVSDDAVSYYAKSGNGYASITLMSVSE